MDREGNRASQEKYLPIDINCIFYMERLEVERIIKDDIKKISTMHQLLFILTSSEEYIEGYIANT